MTLFEHIFWIIFSTFSALFCCFWLAFLINVAPKKVQRLIDDRPNTAAGVFVIIYFLLFFLFYFTAYTY